MSAPLPAPKLPAVHRAIAAPERRRRDARSTCVLTLPPAGADGKSEFQVNGAPFWKAKPFLATLGETQIWTVRNDSKLAHPFHLHGFFFLPLDEKLEPIRPMAWKDTLNVPMEGTMRFLVVFDERPGHVDVPLPHPRSRGRRPDGARPGWRGVDDRSPAPERPLNRAPAGRYTWLV